MEEKLEEIYKKWEEIINIFNDRIPQVDVEKIREYIDHNELELSIEYLAGTLFDFKIKITQEEYDKIANLGKKIGLTPYHWQLIDGLVDKS